MIENYGNAIFLKNAYLLLIVFDVNDIFISQDIVYSSFVFLFVFPWNPRYFIFFFFNENTPTARLHLCFGVMKTGTDEVFE